MGSLGLEHGVDTDFFARAIQKPPEVTTADLSAATAERFFQAMEALRGRRCVRTCTTRSGCGVYYTPGADDIEVTLPPGGKPCVGGGT